MKRTPSLTPLIREIARKGSRSLRRLAQVAALLLMVGLTVYSVSPATQILDVADLKVARVGHTATELTDGRIMIVGGQNSDGPITDSEIFDPASRTFSLGAKSLEGRTEHSATLCADGRVLVIGGRGANGLLDSTEIYQSATNAFSPGPKLNRARAGHTATMLADGRLLVAGGDEEGSAEVFYPDSGRFELIEARLETPRSFHSAVLLHNGRVLIAGGVTQDGKRSNLAEVFDPESLGFTATAIGMRGERSRPALNILPDGKVQVIAGDDDGTMEMFNPDGEYFTAYAHLLNGTTNRSAIMRTKTRASLIQRDISRDAELRREFRGEVNQLLDRRGHTLTEIGRSNLALAAGGVNSGGALQTTAVLFSSSNATVTSDKTNYSPGMTVVLTGGGWQSGETIQMLLHVEPQTHPDVILTSAADENGNFTNSSYIVVLDDLGVTFTLTATGQSSSYVAQTTFTDESLDLYENSSRTLARDAFAWGQQIFAAIGGASTGNCYRNEWIRPDATIAETHDLPGSSGGGGNPRLDSFTVPASGPSGVWSARQYKGGATSGGVCASVTTFTLQNTLAIDVARAVIAGAVETGGVGGDTHVEEDHSTTNYGSTAAINVRADSTKKRRGFVRTELGGAGISGTITSAKLRLNLNKAPGGAHSVDARRITLSWLESSMTWDTQPGFTGSVTDTRPVGTTDKVNIRWSVTSDVQGFIDGTFSNFGWRLTDSTDGGSAVNGESIFNSTEASATDKTVWPVLLVDFDPCTAPHVTTQPGDQTVEYGNNAQFSAAANGNPAPSVQWQVSTDGGNNFTDISGATSTTLTVSLPTVAQSGNKYRAVFSNTCGGSASATSNVAALTVTHRPVTVTADAKTKVYSDADPGLTYQVTSGSLVNGDSLTGALTRVAGETVAGSPYAIQQGTLTAGANYSLTYIGANLTITARLITVTADAKTKVYGEADPALTYQVTSGSLVNGDAFTGAISRVAGETVAGSPYAIQQGTLTAGTNYSLTYIGANLTITARLITVTADAKTKVYGDADPALTYQVTNGSLLNGDAFSGALTRVAGETVAGSPYAIQQGTLTAGTNYGLTFVGANLTITPRPVTTTADAKTKVYGEADPALTYQITSGSLANGDAFTGALTRVAGETVAGSPYAIEQGTLALNGNYNLSFVGANLTITTRPVTVTADAKTKVYGEADPALTYQITSGSLVNSDAFTGALTRVAGGTVAGSPYAIQQGTLALNSNYDLSFVGANLTITARPVTVTADGKTKVYGEADPALTYQITSGSLVNGEDFTGGFTRAAGETVAGSPYAIQQGTLALNSNYNLSFIGANLTITARPLTVTADAKTKVYGGADPALTYQITNGLLVNGDAFTGALTRVAGETVAGSPYAIQQGTLAAGTNYNLTFIGANLTITVRSITVTADAKSKAYGDADPALTYQITSGSLANGDAFTGGLTRVAGETAAGSPYAILQGTLALNGNYSLSFVGAHLTITARPITVTADAKSKVYGNPDPALTYQITNGSLANGDAFTGALARAAGENVGLHAINQGTLALNSNYALSFVGANLEITARALTVTADAKTKVYGAADPALTYQITSGSLVNGNALTGALARVTGESVAGSPYAILQGTLTAGTNYNLAFIGASLSVTARPIAVTADAKTKTYFAADPVLTWQITNGSLVNGDSLTGALARVAGETVAGNPYAIQQGTLAASGNYSLTFFGANLAITRAAPIVSVSGGIYYYDGTPKAAVGSATGVDGSDLGPVTLIYTPGGANAPVNPGVYTVTASIGETANHTAGSASKSITVVLGTSAGTSCIAADFNSTAIAAGRYIWFNSVFEAAGLGSSPVTIYLFNSKIQFNANGVDYNLSVPNAMVTFDPAATAATTVFDGANNRWVTRVPSGLGGKMFLAALPYLVPVDLPGGIKPVTWCGTFMSDTPGVTVKWKWAAAVYSQLSSDPSQLDVKPVDDTKASVYKNSDKGGTPENFKAYVIPGARGGGGSNYDGGYTGTDSVKF